MIVLCGHKDTIKLLDRIMLFFPYNPGDLHNIPVDDFFLSIDDQSFFEQLLLETRRATILGGKTKRKQTKTIRKRNTIFGKF